jgi:F0F1-type ATP synthase alpha subunit
VEKQVLIIYAANAGMLDDLALNQCKAFEEGLTKFIENAHPGILNGIREKKTIDDQIKAELDATLKEFKAKFLDEAKSAAGAKK